MIFPNWFKDVEKYFRHVPQVPLRVLQIGTYTGDATEWLLNNRTIERINDVDTWQGSVEVDHESIDFSEVEKYYDSRITDDRVIKCKMTSDEFFIVNEMSYNFSYIDGDHTASQTAPSADAKTVNITVTFNQADEASAMRFARQVQTYIDRENNNSMIGSN